MVRIGHMGPQRTFVEYRFHNPDTTLGIEVLSVDELQRRLPPEARRSLHRADFHQFFVVTEGEIDAVVDFAEYVCREGDVLLVRPGQVVRLPAARPGSAAIAVLFTPVFPQPQPLVESVLGPFGVTVYRTAFSEVDPVVTAAAELASAYNAIANESSTGLTGRALLRQMLGVLLLRMTMVGERERGPGDDAAHVTVRRFLSDLDRLFAADRSASAYARRLGYSLRTLNRACLTVTGRGAKELIDARVVLEAKRLLAHTDMPVASLSRSLGFSEPTNFGKFFDRRVGESPGVFRASSRQLDHSSRS